MSMRLQAKLRERLSSHIESRYAALEDVISIEGVQAEMVFEASQGFMTHETEAHDYLPCFHLIGQIKEIRGKFPFNVSSLYFKDSDAQALVRDIMYYPTPEEIGYLVNTAKFYSKNFSIPQVLARNSYVLPCIIDMTVVPPSDPVAYENNLFSNFGDLADEDKVNLPTFYVGITGTGVSRKNDKLLNYYGIDLDPNYAHYVVTAESSGYFDPPLMMYIPEPMVAMQDEAQQQMDEDKFITPEEESEMLHTAEERQRAAQQEASSQIEMDANADFHAPSQEDAIVAEAYQNISRRMEERFNGRHLTLEVFRGQAAQNVSKPEGEERVKPEIIGEEAQPGNDVKSPDMPEQAKEIRIEGQPVSQAELREDTAMQRDAQSDGKSVPFDEEDIITGGVDDFDVRNFEGGDVSDARAQTKVDEAHAKDIAIDAAREQQSDALQDENHEDHGHRALPEGVEEIEAAAKRSNVKTQDGPDII